MNGKHFDVKDMEREYKRGRVEELNYILMLMTNGSTYQITPIWIKERIKEVEKVLGGKP